MIHDDNSFHKQSQQDINIGEEMKLSANISVLYLCCKYWYLLCPLIRWYYIIIIIVQSYTGQVCSHLYCYECTAYVTMPMTTNEWHAQIYHAWLASLDTNSYKPCNSTDHMACSTDHMTCSTDHMTCSTDHMTCSTDHMTCILITWLIVLIGILKTINCMHLQTSPLPPICTFMRVWLDTW